MSVNHESAFSGHLGAKKAEVRILPNFFLPGLRQDVIRFCRSCHVCLRTIKKGIVKKAPLGSLPLIDTPFKRVAVDIVGPIVLPVLSQRQILGTGNLPQDSAPVCINIDISPEMAAQRAQKNQAFCVTASDWSLITSA